MSDASQIIKTLNLRRHPEGGWYRETWRDQPPAGDGRGHGTAIYYLLEQGQRSHWHQVDAVEIWHYYAGAPLTLEIYRDGAAVRTATLGPDVLADQVPQVIVPAHAWQSAYADQGWTLVGCTVSPAFEFAGFELAPEGWRPPVDG